MEKLQEPGGTEEEVDIVIDERLCSKANESGLLGALPSVRGEASSGGTASHKHFVLCCCVVLCCAIVSNVLCCIVLCCVMLRCCVVCAVLSWLTCCLCSAVG